MRVAARLHVVLLALALAASTLACQIGFGGGIAVVPDDPGDDPNDFGRPGDPAGYSHSKAIAATCRCMADHAAQTLAATVTDMQGGTGAPPAGSLLQCMTQSAVLTGGASTLGVPRRAPAPLSAGRTSDRFATSKDVEVTMDDSGQLGVTGAGASVVALDAQAAAISEALREATTVEQTCNAMALQRATSLWTLTNTRDVNSGLRDLPGYVAKERARLVRVLTASHRANATAAAATSLAAAFRKTAVTRSGKALDASLEALAPALSAEAQPATEAELEALMQAGRHDSDVILQNANEWARGQVAEGHGAAGGAPAAGPVLREQPTSDAAAVAGAFLGLMRGDYGAIVRGAAVLFPKDSPIRHGLTATGALLQGDVATAVHAASRMVPADSKMGTALRTVSNVIDAVDEARRTR